MNLYDISFRTLTGLPASLAQFRGHVILIVNVASYCGLTPQYAGLERLQERYRDAGFTVVAFPCNQFGGQEPGTAEEIAGFCSTAYRISFPLFEKIDVNGDHRHPLYTELSKTPDAAGEAGDIRWNFEKFLLDTTGSVAGRFRPTVEPEAKEIVGAIEKNLLHR